MADAPAKSHVTVSRTRMECLRDLKVPSESLSLTVLGKEFHVCGAEKRKTLLAKPVGLGYTDERLGQLCSCFRMQSPHTVACSGVVCGSDTLASKWCRP